MPPNQQYPGTNGNQAPQQSNGRYEVLPPLPTAPNSGHSGHNPYEFIVNPQASRRGPNLFGGDKFLLRVAVLLGGLIAVVIIVAVIVSALAPKSPVADMTAVVQRQQEIIRVSTAAASQVSSQDAKNFMSNVETSVTSEQQQAINYLSSHHTKLKDKVLAMDQSSDTDAQLANAAATNTYDTTSIQIVTGELSTYQSLLQTTFKDTSNADLKQQLQQSYTAAGMLLNEAKHIGTE